MSIKLNKYKYLIPVVLLVFLLFPKPAHALIPSLTEILTYLTENAEEFISPMALSLIGALFFYVLGIINLVISTWILQLTLENQTIWLTSLDKMTHIGWNFMAGLANMFLVIILLIIAFAFILKIETFQAQKALPRLIIIALLLNFSWFFVKMLIDLTQIVYETILNAAGENLLFTTLNAFFGGIAGGLADAIFWLALILAPLKIPIVGTWKAIAFFVGYPLFILPNILVWTFKTFCFFSLSTFFLILAILFAGRVFVLQILAILSPIAFLALILPQTRSHWDDWLKHLTSWLLLGVFLLFFLVLGFKGLGYIIPEALFGFWTSPVPIPGLAWGELGKYIFYYFAICVYLAMLLYINKKYLPLFAAELLDFVKQAAGFVIDRGIKPLHKATYTEFAQRVAKSEKIKEVAERLALAEAPTPGKLARLGWAVKRQVGMALGPDIRKFQMRRRHEAAEKMRGKGALAQGAFVKACLFDDQRLGGIETMLGEENWESEIARERKIQENKVKERKMKKEDARLLQATEKRKEIEEKEKPERNKYGTDEEYREAYEKYQQKLKEAKKSEYIEGLRVFKVEDAYRMADELEERGKLRAAFPRVAMQRLVEKMAKERGKKVEELSTEEYEEFEKEAWKTIISAIKPEQLVVTPITTVELDDEFVEKFIELAKAPLIDAYFRRFRLTGERAFEEKLMNLALKESLAEKKVIPVSKVLKKINPEARDYFKSMIGWGLIDLPGMDEKLEDEVKKMGIKLKEEIEEEIEKKLKETTNKQLLKEIVEKEIEKRKKKTSE